MDRYVDIRILPDPEFPTTVLMNALFQKLHRGLVEVEADDIGVSFPGMDEEKPSLGNRLRLHGTEVALERLMQSGWLQGMRDHVTVSGAVRVPDRAVYRVVRRVQAKSNPERLRRRRMRRKGESWEDAVKAIPDTAAEKISLPYVKLRSSSTKQTFPVFVQHDPIRKEPVPGSFNAYGLSGTATIPWF